MQKKRLIVRIGNRSLTFATWDGEGQEGDGITLLSYPLNAGISMAANLREALKQIDAGDGDYERCYLMVDGPRLVVPLELYCEAERDDLFLHSYPRSAADVVEQNVVADLNAVALFSLNKDIKTVILDRFADTKIVCSIAPVWRHLYQRSFTGQRNKLYAYFHDGLIDVACFGQKRLRFANQFKASGEADASYFLLYAWKQLQMDQEQDELHLVGDLPGEASLQDNLKKYVRRVYVINPYSDFNRSPIAQTEGMPYDMMVFFIKGR